MTPSERKRVLVNFKGNSPADLAAIQQFEAQSHICLPEEYAEFLHQTNGGEGFVGNAYVILWPVEELLQMNEAYQVADYAPGLLLFGSDGGGEAWGFDMRSDAKPIVSVPFVGMELQLARPVASNFDAFLEELFKS